MKEKVKLYAERANGTMERVLDIRMSQSSTAIDTVLEKGCNSVVFVNFWYKNQVDEKLMHWVNIYKEFNHYYLAKDEIWELDNSDLFPAKEEVDDEKFELVCKTIRKNIGSIGNSLIKELRIILRDYDFDFADLYNMEDFDNSFDCYTPTKIIQIINTSDDFSIKDQYFILEENIPISYSSMSNYLMDNASYMAEALEELWKDLEKKELVEEIKELVLNIYKDIKGE
jgi:hypothetical protein